MIREQVVQRARLPHRLPPHGHPPPAQRVVLDGLRQHVTRLSPVPRHLLYVSNVHRAVVVHVRLRIGGSPLRRHRHDVRHGDQAVPVQALRLARLVEP